MDDRDTRMCYYVSPTIKDKNGEFIVAIIKENVSGYFPTDWRWGNDVDLARDCARKKNEALGYNKEDVNEIVLSSMFPNRKKQEG